MTPDEATEFVQTMSEMIQDKLFSGKIDKDFLNLFIRLKTTRKI